MRRQEPKGPPGGPVRVQSIFPGTVESEYNINTYRDQRFKLLERLFRKLEIFGGKIELKSMKNSFT